MTEISELQAGIERTVGDLKSSYGETLRAVADLKEKMNRFELIICRGDTAKAKQAMIDRNSAAENLDKLTDSLISKNKSAWEQYRKFEDDCQRLGFKPLAQNDLKMMCEKTERLAADLLCYALGRFRTKNG